MLVSVVIPTKDCVDTIDQALTSVHRVLQGISHEIVVSDGNSKDGTAQYLAQCPYAIRIASHSDNSLYDGLNKAIEQARGRFILWLNADDQLESGAADICAQAEQSSADMITGEAAVDIPGRERWRSDNAARQLSMQTVLFGVLAINCRLISRNSLQKLSGFQTDLGLAADREFMLRFLNGNFVREHMPSCVYAYRSNPASRTIANTWSSFINVHEANRDLARQLIPKTSDQDQLATLKTFSWLSEAALLRARLANRDIGAGLADCGVVARGLLDPATVAQAVGTHRKMRGLASGY